MRTTDPGLSSTRSAKLTFPWLAIYLNLQSLLPRLIRPTQAASTITDSTQAISGVQPSPRKSRTTPLRMIRTQYFKNFECLL